MEEIQRFRNRNRVDASEPIEPKKPSAFRIYREVVRKMTEAVKHKIPGIENRGFLKEHIDHKVSIWHGFKNGIPPEKIADISNLRMLPYLENMRKGTKIE